MSYKFFKNKKGDGTELGSTVVEVLIAILVIGLLVALIYAVIYASSRNDAEERASETLDEIASQMNALKGKPELEFNTVIKLTSNDDWKYLVYLNTETSSGECMNAEDYFPGQGCICIFSIQVDNHGCTQEGCEGYCRNAEYPVYFNNRIDYGLNNIARDFNFKYTDKRFNAIIN